MSSFLDKISKLPPEEKPVDVSEQSFPNSIKDSLLTPEQTSLQRKVAQPEDSLTRLRKEFGPSLELSCNATLKNKMHMMVIVVVVQLRYKTWTMLILLRFKW